MRINRKIIKKKIDIYIYRIVFKIRNILSKDKNDSIKLFWYKSEQNFGDSLNPILLNKLTGKNIEFVKSYSPQEHLFAIGSILEAAIGDTIVWGSGFISENGHCFEKPKKVCAVRGPKSREILINDGIECPKVYGDPALLLPKIYCPSINKKYKFGIIAHYVDKDNEWFKKLKKDDKIKIIDIQNPDIFAFIDEVLECEKIVSSSLHGLIVADAYSIPSLWVEFSDKVIGNGFKFLDYFLSVKRKDTKPLIINKEISVEDITKHFYDYQIDINLDKLLDMAPFEIKNNMLL